MSFLDNLRLSKEDDEVLAEGGSEPSEIDVTEAIQAEEDALEVAETEQAIESEQAEIETQSEVVEELEEQNAAIEEKLENPTEVTPEDVAVAQEAFAFTLGRLAGKSEVYKAWKSTKVSSEEARKDPVTSLKLHQEGVKEVAAKVWDSIKVMFQKIVEFFKKLWVKLPAIFTNYVKKFEALKSQVNSLDDAFDGTSKTVEVSKKHLKPIYSVEGASFDNYVNLLFDPLAAKLPSQMAALTEKIKKDIESGGLSYVEQFVSSIKLTPAKGVKIDGGKSSAVLGLTNDGCIYISKDGSTGTASNEKFKGVTFAAKKKDLLKYLDGFIKLARDKDVVLKENDKMFKTIEASVNEIVKKGIDNNEKEKAQDKAKLVRNIIIKLPNICLKTYMVMLKSAAGSVSEVIKK